VVEEVGIWPLSRGGEVHFGVEIGARRLTDAPMQLAAETRDLESFNSTTVGRDTGSTEQRRRKGIAVLECTKGVVGQSCGR
jgi:hypothetical protein